MGLEELERYVASMEELKKNVGIRVDELEKHHRAASIPKFGAWDETDPRSGEGFTVIFNRVKEEKQIASTTFPSVPTQPGSPRNKGNSSSRSKRFFIGSFVLLKCQPNPLWTRSQAHESP
ncbi:hypothetical protein NC653_010130 [Populus alba x Populus x berolinensis]|uniref:RIN4 pathogenic type III effector avirulence factor Avr cleavage site domain-containing protein n=1 Tax=Populus alba x Populus x berolinensis TaxID=444605 RepID=A0AAD6QZ23_9ROSI|nr:hypothetical protein NC653_010130 [Populus alba x Populus x berolinensis]